MLGTHTIIVELTATGGLIVIAIGLNRLKIRDLLVWSPEMARHFLMD